jgi:hypothetical protein
MEALSLFWQAQTTRRSRCHHRSSAGKMAAMRLTRRERAGHVQNAKCSKCGHDAVPDGPCPGCGQAAVNGIAKQSWVKPAPPPEAANWVIDPVPPELAEDFRRSFDEAAFVADMEETLKTGGADIDALIARIERKAQVGN